MGGGAKWLRGGGILGGRENDEVNELVVLVLDSDWSFLGYAFICLEGLDLHQQHMGSWKQSRRVRKDK